MTVPDDTRFHANFYPGGYVEVFETDAPDGMPVVQTSDGSAAPETLTGAERFLSDNGFRRTGEWEWGDDRETATVTVRTIR